MIKGIEGSRNWRWGLSFHRESLAAEERSWGYCATKVDMFWCSRSLGEYEGMQSHPSKAPECHRALRPPVLRYLPRVQYSTALLCACGVRLPSRCHMKRSALRLATRALEGSRLAPLQRSATPAITWRTTRCLGA